MLNSCAKWRVDAWIHSYNNMQRSSCNIHACQDDTGEPLHKKDRNAHILAFIITEYVSCLERKRHVHISVRELGVVYTNIKPRLADKTALKSRNMYEHNKYLHKYVHTSMQQRNLQEVHPQTRFHVVY
jgi:hypothetical protein